MTTIYYNFYSSSSLFHGSILNIMGTRLDLVMIVPNLASGVKLWDKLVSELEKLDLMLNRYLDNSEITLVNKWAADQPVTVSDEFWDILTECKNFHRLTLGLFDITLRDYALVELNKESKAVFLKENDIKIDLGGYAKGYTLEKLKKLLRNAKISQAFINFGNSSMGCIGVHPQGENQRVSIGNPLQPDEVLDEVILDGKSLSVSGTSFEMNRHTVRPFTGELSPERKIVCIQTLNAAIAEVLSTAFLLATTSEKEKIRQNFRDIAEFKEKEYYAT